MTNISAEEKQFYSQYEWCLNPALSIEDLLLRFHEELERYEGLAGWQREESKINLYLFTCAIACTADDYLARHSLNLSPLSNHYPKLRIPVAAAQTLIDISDSVRSIANPVAWQWRQRWDDCVDHACEMLLSESPDEQAGWNGLVNVSAELRTVKLPNAMLKRKMRLPEAFRHQDMTHHDVISLSRRFCESIPASDQHLVLLGLRTAGAYFAPLMTVYLKQHHWPEVSWFSIRPKNGLSRYEAQRIRRVVKNDARLLVIDDYPATGRTLKLTVELLEHLGARLDQMVVVAPTHHAQPRWTELAGIDGRIAVCTIQPHELYKNALLTPASIESLYNSYASASGNRGRIIRDPELGVVNAQLARHSQDGHHVREKRVVALEVKDREGLATKRRIFCKSVGWGWLGYHAYIAGMRLKDYVPPVLGLRNGLLMTDWINADGDRSDLSSPSMVEAIAAYVAARTRNLPLSGDCRLESRNYRWTGLDEMLHILRAAYGPFINRFKIPALRKVLQRYITSVPTLIDGRMRPEEWLRTSTGIYKIDFEHHNFGGAELDIVDPAYDLAAAIFEFGLSKGDARELLEIYQRQSGDSSINERVVLHKILYGSLVMKHALGEVVSGKSPEANNVRYHNARNFLVYSMTDFCAKRANLNGATKPARWSESLFFMDLDGVFDQELLGFCHATQSGLKSIALLRSRGFSVVLNTGRSVQHVREYCQSYGLPGGIAEFGGVFVDAVDGRELPLISRAGAEQLARCREAIRELDGVFVDPGYEYSIRAYRYSGRATIGLESSELKTLLKNHGFSNLTCICRGGDSYIVQKRTSKGAALQFVRRQVGSPSVPVTAIGDSAQDVGMLKAADFVYAPANCSSAIRKLAKTGSCRILKERFQNGLLAAVRHRLRQDDASAGADFQLAAGTGHLNSLMLTVLKAADRRSALQLFTFLAWWSL